MGYDFTVNVYKELIDSMNGGQHRMIQSAQGWREVWIIQLWQKWTLWCHSNQWALTAKFPCVHSEVTAVPKLKKSEILSDGQTDKRADKLKL